MLLKYEHRLVLCSGLSGSGYLRFYPCSTVLTTGFAGGGSVVMVVGVVVGGRSK